MLYLYKVFRDHIVYIKYFAEKTQNNLGQKPIFSYKHKMEYVLSRVQLWDGIRGMIYDVYM